MKVTQYLLPLFAALVFGFSANAQSDLVLGGGIIAFNENDVSKIGASFNAMGGNNLSAIAFGFSFSDGDVKTASFTYMLPSRQRFNAPNAWFGGGFGVAKDKFAGNIRLYYQNGNIVLGGGVDYIFNDEVEKPVVGGVSIGYNIHRKVR